MKDTEILSIPLNCPEQLFPNDLDGAKKIRNSLVMEWHTDKNTSPNSQQVVGHINALYDAVVEKIQGGRYGMANVLILPINNKTVQIVYHVHHPFEMGQIYYGKNVLAYIFDKGWKDSSSVFNLIVKSFYVEDWEDKELVKRVLPDLIDSFTVEDGRRAIIMKKSTEIICLEDALRYFKGKMEPTAVAWILNRFYTILSYCHSTGLTHNALSTLNCFISPKDHGGYLFGGWMHSVGIHCPMKTLPSLSSQMAPQDLLSKKVGDYRLDQTLIKVLGRKLLGDQSGTALQHDKEVPKALVSFLNGAIGPSIFEDHKGWKEILKQNFGPRKFVEMNLNLAEVYKGI